jgi:predicted NBD/HSP70 family sugar kinase
VNPIRFGIDLGGTKIEILALGAAGEECLRHRIATPAGDYRATIEAVATLVNEAERELGAKGTVGIATPGAISLTTGRIKNANSTCLNGQPLLDDLQRALARPVRIENDANCFALSEATDGAAAGARVVFGVILGTGVGGGIVAGGKTLTGANAIAGEWGHNPLPQPTAGEIEDAPRCYCGRTNCIETWLSGPGMSADHFRATEETLGAAQIAARAGSDRDCDSTLRRYEERLARALGGVINILDPEIIVLGGGMSNIARLYESVPRLWLRHVFSGQVATQLVAPRFGDASGARGAAWLWNNG